MSLSMRRTVVTNFVVEQQVRLQEFVARLSDREEGQDMIEYALLAALIAIAAIAVIVLVGPQLRLLFQDVVNALNLSP